MVWHALVGEPAVVVVVVTVVVVVGVVDLVVVVVVVVFDVVAVDPLVFNRRYLKKLCPICFARCCGQLFQFGSET